MKTKRVVIPALLLFFAVLLGGCRDDTSGTEKFPIRLTNERIDLGERVYSENCALCHGPVEGPVAVDPAPVHSAFGHTWHHPDRLLYQWVLDGPPLATAMVPFRETLTEEEVVAVIAYIKNNWPSDIQRRQNQASAQYEAQVVEFGTD
ncbi:MAG: cytochrome c [Dehalococcoidia bacterium]|nr:cytochrome c [Dehalococcoidia bacterium]|tara:strand:+ start:66 stop:509 length:444 start_codon:yes stop_codon:yes gene_type:complete